MVPGLLATVVLSVRSLNPDKPAVATDFHHNHQASAKGSAQTAPF